jgi:hypothetical protein
MKTINVEGLPEPITQALDNVVHVLREQLRRGEARAPRERVQLPTWPLGTKDALRREAIYDDIG